MNKNYELKSKAKNNPAERKKLIIGLIIFVSFAVLYEMNKKGGSSSSSSNSSSSSGSCRRMLGSIMDSTKKFADIRGVY